VYIHCSKGFCHGMSPMKSLYFNEINPPLLLSITSYYSTVFSVFCYAILLHRWNTFQYAFLFTIILFSSPSSPQSPKHVVHITLYTTLYIIMFIFVQMFIFWIYVPHMKEKCDLCLSKPGLLHLTGYSPAPSIYLQMT
jgi:hypothetical protein